ncbi:putative cytoplasmic protein [Beutenbergia cavernae DSM 12333]|uniref:Putative cytoplasmic protein n=1 Tax=Beutenbergia cavernae (strain ATCC BAA-8 / DSM 12333 / CCUG 43141 / JCM 11478 / NBRC 16432 / NCIMB 13614 / HKI 0122) TaxID=471853 RepID=C5C334_BEUC1|nr:DUF3151 domain-containing protein [Beutenbergia cavernae]ACQ81878.1 putative cytoplasmic protein [Beutenbergia cavernae DSM 12333]
MSESLGERLSVGPEQTLLPADHPDMSVRAELGDGAADPRVVRELAARFPASSLAWALLARAELAGLDDDAAPGDAVAAYAYARVGYHRGLDALRKAGWRGRGPVPVSHVPNQGFLLALLALGDAAAAIGETEEAERIVEFLADSDPTAADMLR